MKEPLPLFLGVFSVMALSNAIVPVLASFGSGAFAQGTIYSSYFLGAFLFVLPSGFLSDRVGELPLVRTGLGLTLVSGILLMTTTAPLLLIIYRLVEGVGAGLFIPSALSILNARADHQTGSGYFMALLNIGLVAGLIGGGLLVEGTGMQFFGIVFFTLLTVIPAVLSLFLHRGIRSQLPGESLQDTGKRLLRVTKDYFWLWMSSIILLGITGALTALYPAFSSLQPGILGITIASMSISTAVTIIDIAHVHVPPIPAIRFAALGMAVSVMFTFISPFAFILVGAMAGIVMIAQLSFLAVAEARQGVAMGLFSTASYGGMTLLPFIAGGLAEISTYFWTFFILALAAASVAVTVGWCRCRTNPVMRDDAPGAT
jgi:MFS family permease